MNFECHITVPKEDSDREPEVFRRTVEHFLASVSCIDGDPELGPGLNAFATFCVDDLQLAIARMDRIVDALIERGFRVKRKKIECIILDVKFNLKSL